VKTLVFVRGVTKQDVISLITDNGAIPGRAKSLIQQTGVLKIILDKHKRKKNTSQAQEGRTIV